MKGEILLKKKLLVIGSAGVRLTLGCDRLPYAGECADGTKYAYGSIRDWETKILQPIQCSQKIK